MEHNSASDRRELNIRDRHNRVGELAYILHPNYWGKGFATEAAKQMLSYGFSEQKLHRIFAICDPRNISSEQSDAEGRYAKGR